jgi:hypothetical protein
MRRENMTPEEAWSEIVDLFYDLGMPCPENASMIDHVKASISAWRLRDLLEEHKKLETTK